MKRTTYGEEESAGVVVRNTVCAVSSRHCDVDGCSKKELRRYEDGNRTRSDSKKEDKKIEKRGCSEGAQQKGVADVL